MIFKRTLINTSVPRDEPEDLRAICTVIVSRNFFHPTSAH